MIVFLQVKRFHSSIYDLIVLCFKIQQVPTGPVHAYIHPHLLFPSEKTQSLFAPISPRLALVCQFLPALVVKEFLFGCKSHLEWINYNEADGKVQKGPRYMESCLLATCSFPRSDPNAKRESRFLRMVKYLHEVGILGGRGASTRLHRAKKFVTAVLRGPAFRRAP